VAVFLEREMAGFDAVCVDGEWLGVVRVLLCVRKLQVMLLCVYIGFGATVVFGIYIAFDRCRWWHAVGTVMAGKVQAHVIAGTCVLMYLQCWWLPHAVMTHFIICVVQVLVITCYMLLV